MVPAQPSRTAMRVALRRAAHQFIDGQPLVFADPYAIPMLGREATAELARTPAAVRRPFSASLRAWVVARARYAEDVLAFGVRNRQICQYLILGAGLDTFALRNPYPGLRVYEVDHPATQGWKRERLHTAGLTLPASARLVPVDFEQQALPAELERAGFDPQLPTCTAWLGVVPYLSPAAFAETCRFLARFPGGSGVVFDYGQPRAALPPVEQLMQDSLASRVAQSGEPFQLFFTPLALQFELAGYGLSVAEDLGSEDLNFRYLHGRTDGLAILGSASRLCQAEMATR